MTSPRVPGYRGNSLSPAARERLLKMIRTLGFQGTARALDCSVVTLDRALVGGMLRPTWEKLTKAIDAVPDRTMAKEAIGELPFAVREVRT